MDNRFRGMSAEQIYSLLESESQTDQDSGHEGEEGDSGKEESKDEEPGEGDSDSPSTPVTEGGIGQVLDAPPPDEETPTIEEQTREWDVAVNQARRSPGRRARFRPGSTERSKVRQWPRSTGARCCAGFGRRPPQPTTAGCGRIAATSGQVSIFPVSMREGVGEIAIAVDCSGSVNGRQLRLFEAEVRSILEGQRPERVYVLYFDAAVQKVETYEAGQRVDLQPVGGGGTEFGPCFEWLDERGILPQTMVFLTDLYGGFPDSAPAYPVLWASTGGRRAPFGEVIPMQAA